ncbi:tripartite tricarboxylate transporter substrate-binding protein [Deferribacter thermophilus]|uniref:Bug family tripartite tricarboxylate transporter substrate binding protein n=1 Tax=Deferribacter thermophilus TaxID=53573 RepID=UPI003C1D79F5
MFKKLFKSFLAVFVVSVLFLGFSPQVKAFEPENPECIAPANPGGGWDFICRTTSKYLFELGLLKQTMRVTNMAGGGGGVAFAHVTKERNNDNNLIVAASTSTVVRLAQGIYKGAGLDSVHWVGTFGAEFGVIAVGKKSKFKSLKELMEAVKQNPRSVGFAGGSSVGGWDHLKVMLLARAAGVKDVKKLKYVAFAGGGEAVTSVLSGSVEAFTGDLSEVRGFIDSGDIRVLAVLAPKRLKIYPNIPTAKEQGYDVIGANWRGYYMPKGASKEAKEYWTKTLKKMAETEVFQKDVEAKGMEIFINFGKDMDKFVKENYENIYHLSKEIGLIR